MRGKVTDGLNWFINNIVVKIAETVLLARYLFVVLVFVIVGFAFYQVGSGTIKFIFFPQIESDEIRVNLTMPVGTNFETTRYYTNQIMDGFYQVADDITGGNKEDLYENISISAG